MTKETDTKILDISALKPEVVFSENGVDLLIKKLKAASKPTLDVTTNEGLEERRTLAAQISRTKTGVFNMGKEYVSELKKVTTLIDGRKRKWWDEVEAYQHEIRKPLTDHENAENERKAGHTSAIQTMRDLKTFDYEPDSQAVEERITKVTEIGKRDFEEFADQAKTVLENSTGRLSEKLAAIIKSEEDAARLKELEAKQAIQDKKDADAQLQKNADDNARKNVQGELDAANERANTAETKVQHTSPAPARDKTPETYNTNAKEAQRLTNQRIVTALADTCMLSNAAAKAVVTAIVKGNIPNIQINY